MNVSVRIYGWLLLVYPVEFRRTFGDQMLQVFRDCYRAEAGSGSLPGLWLRTLVDLALTAPKERFERKGNFMNRRSDAIAMLACVAIIVIAFAIHRYAIRNNLPFIFWIGYILDALIVAGVIGNFIVFLLAKTTKLNPLRTAITVFAVVHAALLLLIAVIASSVGPTNWAGVLIGYLVSYVIWVGLHFAWRMSNRSQALNSQH